MSEDKQKLIAYFVERAEETFHDAKKLSSDSAWNSALNRLYYACFYAVQAALHQKINLNVKTHSGIKTLFNFHFTKEKMISLELSSFYSLLMQRRGESDYAAFEKINADDVLPLIPQAEEFIQALKNIIHSSN